VRSKITISIIVIAVIIVSAFGATVSMTARAENSTQAAYTITPDNLQGWILLIATGTGTYQFIQGPGTPPLGIGSAHFELSGAADTSYMYTYSPGTGILISDLTSLSYYTYQDSTSPGDDDLVPAFFFSVDYDLTDEDFSWQGEIFFEPYRTPANDPQKGVWQMWNALTGLWWTNEGPGLTYCPSSTPCSLADLLTHFPNMGILGGFGFKLGDGWEDGFTGSVDDLVIGTDGVTDTYDFEPLPDLSLTDLALLQTKDPLLGPWTAVPGSFASGFNMPLDTSTPDYYLDTNAITVNRPLMDGYYSFFIDGYPAGFFAYWADQGVVSGATGWRGYMWQIINGNLPVFLLKVTGTDYMLVDGLGYAMGEDDEPWQVAGTYLPGAYTFVGNVSDAYGYTDDVSLDIIFNDVPVAESQSVSTNEDTPLAITLVADDLYPGTLTWTIVSGPAHGGLTGTAPNVTYHPVENYHGSDSFTFKVNDGSVDSAPATVSITVSSINDAPVITEGASTMVTMSEDGSPTPFDLTLHATDADGDTLTWSISTAAAHGTATASGSGNSKAIGYAPNTNYNGADSFVVQVSDGNLSDTILVNVTIQAVDDAPVAEAQSVTTAEDTAKPIALTASDVEDDPLSWTIVSTPTHGTLSGTAPDMTYTPDQDFTGPDSFTLQEKDGLLDSNVATVSINVTPVNDAPVAYDQSVTVDENKAKAIILTGSDKEDDPLTWIITSAPSHGTLSGAAPYLVYTPVSFYYGEDSFTFKVNDGESDSAIATISITINKTINVFYLPMIKH
jgi:hypothetical protein